MSEMGDGAVVRPCVEALAGRQEELRHALAGRSLFVLVAYAEGDALRVMLTRSGLVSLVPADQAFQPQLEINGPSQDIHSFLAGRMSLGDAVLAGIVTLHIDEDEAAAYGDLRSLVADVVAGS